MKFLVYPDFGLEKETEISWIIPILRFRVIQAPSLLLPNSLESASLVSEPPDIRNWFGSYVYESPVLDTSDDFKSSANHRRGCEKDAFVIRDSFKEKVENADLGRS
ncbi:hypothetical protein SLA2020_529130 [Shorea laevis]